MRSDEPKYELFLAFETDQTVQVKPLAKISDAASIAAPFAKTARFAWVTLKSTGEVKRFFIPMTRWSAITDFRAGTILRQKFEKDEGGNYKWKSNPGTTANVPGQTAISGSSTQKDGKLLNFKPKSSGDNRPIHT